MMIHLAELKMETHLSGDVDIHSMSIVDLLNVVSLWREGHMAD
jgi:hypothetical protein